MKVERFLGLKIILYFFIHILSVRNQRVGILSCFYDNDFSLINPIFTRYKTFCFSHLTGQCPMSHVDDVLAPKL